MKKLHKVTNQLRDPKTGCPWDKEQSFESIADCTIEEAYEVVEAIEAVATGNSGFHADVPLETVMIESVDINE